MTKWEKYTGQYTKQFYDIRLTNGDIYLSCWPNAGDFHGDGRRIDGKRVASIRVSKEQS